MQTEFIHVGGELYQVLRHVKESSNPIVDTWKEHLLADKVFRKEGYYFFCRLVEDATILEEIPLEKLSEEVTEEAKNNTEEDATMQ